MKLRYLLAALCLWPMLAQAEIYKSIDANGHVTYSSTPLKGGKRIVLDPLPTMAPPARGRSTASPENFPKVDEATQKGRDETRRRILEDELSAEERNLAEAEEALKAGESNPEVHRGAGGKTYRNVEKYEAKIKTLTDQVKWHQNNIEALKSELTKLK